MVKSMQLGKYPCKIYKDEQANKIIVWFVDAQKMELPDRVYEKLKIEKPDISYAMVVIGISDWNRELSPWQAPAVFGEEAFDGEGIHLQKWLREEGMTKILEQLELQKKNVELFVGGYSLAGLFALWLLSETDIFQGAVSCSGSLWYPGWMEYAKTHLPQKESRIYLSLGKKEEKVRNATLSTIGDCTRKLYGLYTKTKEVQKVVLEWNDGNHFTNIEERMVKGFLWLLGKE